MSSGASEQQNYGAIKRLEDHLGELRADRSTARETEAIREIGLEIALAIREVGAMLVNVGWEQTYAAARPERTDNPERALFEDGSSPQREER